jgi:hypothetical protein
VTDQGETNEPAADGAAGDAAGSLTAILAFLSAEQTYLLSVRSLSYSEAFSRAGTYLGALGAATVTLGLIGSNTGFGSDFLVVTTLLLLVVSFLGLTSFLRLIQLNVQDASTVLALNRIRHAYQGLAPGMERFLATSTHDDERGMMDSLALGSVAPVAGNLLIHGLVTSPATVGTINSAVCGIIVAALLLLASSSSPVVGIGALLTFGLAFAGHVRYQWKSWDGVRAGWTTRFPTPADPVAGPDDATPER